MMMRVDLSQEELEICHPIVINNDKLTERTEYFTVNLRLPSAVEIGSCQVAIVDKNGGKAIANSSNFLYTCVE